MIKQTSDGILFNLKLIPSSSKEDIILEENFIKVKVTAQPIENKANKALIDLLSKYLKMPKSAIEIIKGKTSKEKSIFLKIIDKIKQKEIVDKLTK